MVVQDELADLVRKLVALPTAFASAGGLGVSFGNGGTRGLDCVRRGAQLVGGNVRYDTGLAGSKGGVPGGSCQLSGRSHGMTTS